MSQSRQQIQDDLMAKLRKQFGPNLVTRLEEWKLKAPYPEPTLQLLTRTYLADHIRQMASVVGREGVQLTEEDIAKLVVIINDAIANEIDRGVGR